MDWSKITFRSFTKKQYETDSMSIFLEANSIS